MIATHATSQKWKKNIAEDRNRGRKGHLIKIHVAFQDEFINLYACSLSDYGSNMEHALLVGSHTWKITWDYHDQSFLWWCEFSLFCECFGENFGKTCIKKLFDNVFWILETVLLLWNQMKLKQKTLMLTKQKFR
jgi:hypothetical protein